MSEGWFKVHRCLFEKAIWQQSTPEQKVILITLLGMANHKGREWEWKGKQFKAEPGMLVTSLESISLRCGKGISMQNVRSALNKFKKYGFLTEEVTKTGRLITIENWEVYQGRDLPTNKEDNKELTDDQQSTNKEVTNSQQTANKELTPNKNDKNNKNDKKEKNEEENPPLIPPTLIHKLALDNFGEVSYQTWFMKTEIKEEGELIKMICKNDMAKKILEDRYGPQISLLTGKKISVKVGDVNA